MYLKRQITPDLAESVEALRIKGLHVDREYKRYYPASEVTAHLVGFTNLDGVGQEGLELAFEDWLKGVPGKSWLCGTFWGGLLSISVRLRMLCRVKTCS
ncbi:hypothetical protein [Aliamphritea spongicola]|nr:hypothetical protein [Aliamphritea spongicola]